MRRSLRGKTRISGTNFDNSRVVTYDVCHSKETVREREMCGRHHGGLVSRDTHPNHGNEDSSCFMKNKHTLSSG